MRFNSELFVFLFLPFTLYGFYKLKNTQKNTYLIGWLILCSSLFYCWFSLSYLLMIYACTMINYFLSSHMLHRHVGEKTVPMALLALGIFINLLPLCYFKYTNFILFNISTLTHFNFNSLELTLPLGISFFTFQNITYLVDSYYNRAPKYTLSNYILYILFFPQLIAGPIVLHSEFMPQLEQLSSRKISDDKIIIGLTLFLIGLIKKILISDNVAPWADQVFQATSAGQPLSFIDAWTGLTSFTLQLYFDFSGYTDMALGLSLMVGIILPPNFDSPFKATNIVDFWQRWHMTLSRFFQNYIFVPLAMKYHRKKHGAYLTIIFTMLISGLWHGAAWCFILWGAFHGLLLCLNHVWRKIYKAYHLNWNEHALWTMFCRLLTNVSFAVSLIFFRSDSVKTSLSFFKNITHIHKLFPLHSSFFIGVDFLVIYCLLTMIWTCPNSQTICGLKNQSTRLDKLLNNALAWSAQTYTYAVLTATALASIILYQGLRTINLKTFIYFQF